MENIHRWCIDGKGKIFLEKPTNSKISYDSNSTFEYCDYLSRKNSFELLPGNFRLGILVNTDIGFIADTGYNFRQGIWTDGFSLAKMNYQSGIWFPIKDLKIIPDLIIKILENKPLIDRFTGCSHVGYDITTVVFNAVEPE